MTSTFIGTELPEDVQIHVNESQEIRCSCYNPDKPKKINGVVVGKGGICNRILFKGEASVRPQQFKCAGCGNLITICKA